MYIFGFMLLSMLFSFRQCDTWAGVASTIAAVIWCCDWHGWVIVFCVNICYFIFNSVSCVRPCAVGATPSPSASTSSTAMPIPSTTHSPSSYSQPPCLIDQSESSVSSD